MPFSSKQDRFLIDRAKRDAQGSIVDMVKTRIREDIGPTFEEAARQTTAGKPGLLLLKGGSVALGSFMVGDGLYHLIQGNKEQTEDLFLHNNQMDRNPVRMFAGGREIAAGLILGYLGAVKGPIR